MPTSLPRLARLVPSDLRLAVCLAGALSIGLPSPALGRSPVAESSPSAIMAAPATSSPQPSPLVSTAIEVQAFDLGFTPTTIELPAAGRSRIVLQNVGYVPHNLTVDALGIQVVAARGSSSETTIMDPAPGTYEFYCSISGHKEAGMVGTLVVEGSAPVDPTGAPSPGATTEGPTASG